MREYSKISPQFWVGHTGRQIKALGIETQLIALYLLTNPHCTMVGIYYLPIVYISHETGVSIEGTMKALQSLCDIHFCEYDMHSEYIWVREMAFFQIGAQLDPKDKRVKGINEVYNTLPNLPFLNDFYEKYVNAFHLEIRRESKKIEKEKQEEKKEKEKNFSRIEAPSKSLASQEQEQEQEQKQEKEQEQEQEQEECASSLGFIGPSSSSSSPLVTIPLKNNFSFLIHASMVEEWCTQYPNIDVLHEVHRIKEWNEINPTKRKVQSELLPHIHRWLAEEQQKATQFKFSPSLHSTLFQHNKTIAQAWAAPSPSFALNTQETNHE